MTVSFFPISDAGLVGKRGEGGALALLALLGGACWGKDVWGAVDHCVKYVFVSCVLSMDKCYT